MEDRGEAWAHAKGSKGWRSPPTGYKDKDLVGVPWMLAFAMRADGWFLRQCNIWAKPNCMPESVSDRSTVSHEYVFHFSKSNDYFYDNAAARTPPPPQTETELAHNSIEARKARANPDAKAVPTASRNAIRKHGSTLTGALHGRHADTPLPPGERRSDKQRGHTRKHAGFNARWDSMEKSEQLANGANLRSVWWIAPAQYREGHYAVMPDRLAEICIAAGSPHGGTILDPFGGAGTTGLVADRMGRDAILIELNPEYADMAKRRIVNDAPLFAEVS
jgi:DNA modification methylase